MVKKLLFINFLALLFIPMSLFAQVKISGKVTDASSGETLPGANILIEELSRGSATSYEGTYVIENVPAGNYTIAVSYIGYKTKKSTITVGNSDLVLDLKIEPDFLGLDEVVVTGYSQRDKQAFTGKVSTLGADKLESIPVASIDAALQGNVAGLNITSTTGTPGATQDIRIRGISSINAGADPLFVIDGVPVVNGNFAQSTATSSLGVMANLNPSDIESITVLKDAVSTAPYGARGSNGVIVITTKQGKFGNTTYNVKYQKGTSDRAIDGPGALGSDDWVGLYVDRYNNSLNGTSRPTAITKSDITFWDGTTDTDWGKLVQNDNAAMTDFAISARGGNKDTKFYISSNYLNQEGAQIGSDLDRFTGKVDVTHQLDKKINVSNSMTGSFVQQNGFLEGAGYFGSPVLAEFLLLPIDQPFNEDGTPATTGFRNSIFNPLYIQANDISRKRNARLLNNTKIDVSIMEGLSFNTRLAIDYLQTEEKYYRNPFYGDARPPVSGGVDEYSNRNFNYVWQNTLNYFYNPNVDNRLGVSVISEFQRNYYTSLNAYGQGIAAAGLFNLATTATPQGAWGATSDWATQAYMTLANYTWKNKLFFDGSLRYEGNSRFAADKRWGTFWSIGAGYALSQEEFIKSIGFIDNLKLRASYGKTGNAAIGLNQYQATVGFGSYNDIASILTNQLGNGELTWETANSFDIGLDFGLFDRVNGSVTFFNKVSQDLLYAVPLSRTSGHTSQIQNIGELFNRGIELELNVDLVRTRDFTWNVGANLATLKNEVTKLAKDGNGDDIEIITGTRYGAKVGNAVNEWYMQEWAGVDPANGNPLWFKDIVDADGNVTGKETTSVYGEATRYAQGTNALPTLNAGITTRIEFKGFYASAQFNYAGGNQIYDTWGFLAQSDGAFAGTYNQYTTALDYWTPTNTDATNPAPKVGGNLNSRGTSTRYLYDGDYIRLRTLNIGYNIPSSLVKQAGLRSATIYFVGQNLWTMVFDDKLKFDPEVDSGGFLDLNAQPMRSLTFGININF